MKSHTETSVNYTQTKPMKPIEYQNKKTNPSTGYFWYKPGNRIRGDWVKIGQPIKENREVNLNGPNREARRRRTFGSPNRCQRKRVFNNGQRRFPYNTRTGKIREIEELLASINP